MHTNTLNYSNNICKLDLGKAIHQFLNLSKGKHVSVFTGAGISLDSGLPLASRLIEHILLNISNVRSQIVCKPLSYLPFEGYIEQMINDSNDDTIMQMFTEESLCPNENHRLIARLHRNGAIDRVYTVNFDVLHEKAFNEINIKCNKVYRDEDFTSESYNDNSINLIKLHGCGTDIESMKFVLSSVTTRENRIQREYLTKQLFGNSNEVIVIFGYSASDSFDIVPAIQSINRNKATVIYIDHNEKAGEFVEITENKFVNYVFSDYPGFHISANTTNFIREWYSQCNISDVVPKNDQVQRSWTSYIQSFISSLKSVNYKFLGTICNQAGLLQDAKMFFEKDVEHNQRAYSYQQLAQISLIFKDKSNYVRNIKLAKEIAERETDIYTYIGCLFNEAEFNLQDDDLSSALDLYLEAYMLAAINLLFNQTRMALKGLTYIYAERKDYKRAKLFGSIVVELNNSDDNLREKSDSYINYAEILRKLGDLKSAIVFIDKSIALKQNLHDKISLINALLTKANILKDKQDFIASKKLFDEAYEVAVKYGVEEIIGKIYHQRASLFLIDDDLSSEALQDAYNSYMFYNKTKNIRYSLSSLEQLQRMIIKLIHNIFKRLGTIENTDYSQYLRPFDFEKFRNVSELSFTWESFDNWIREITVTDLDTPKTFHLLELGRKYLENTLEREITIIRNTNDLALYSNTIQDWRTNGIIELDKN